MKCSSENKLITSFCCARNTRKSFAVCAFARVYIDIINYYCSGRQHAPSTAECRKLFIYYKIIIIITVVVLLDFRIRTGFVPNRLLHVAGVLFVSGVIRDTAKSPSSFISKVDRSVIFRILMIIDRTPINLSSTLKRIVAGTYNGRELFFILINGSSCTNIFDRSCKMYLIVCFKKYETNFAIQLYLE